VHALRLVFVIAAVAIAVIVWRSRHGVEVWHAAADVPA
jgi:hypothetical protein